MTISGRSLSKRGNQGFTLIEIMIVVAIIGIIVAIATPTMLRQRDLSQQRACQENLDKIDQAKHIWALEFLKQPGDPVTMDDLYNADGTGHLRLLPKCPSEGTYTLGTSGVNTVCSITAPKDHNEKL